MEQPERVACLVLVATSGGVDVARLGGAERERKHDERSCGELNVATDGHWAFPLV